MWSGSVYVAANQMPITCWLLLQCGILCKRQAHYTHFCPFSLSACIRQRTCLVHVWISAPTSAIQGLKPPWVNKKRVTSVNSLTMTEIPPSLPQCCPETMQPDPIQRTGNRSHSSPSHNTMLTAWRHIKELLQNRLGVLNLIFPFGFWICIKLGTVSRSVRAREQLPISFGFFLFFFIVIFASQTPSGRASNPRNLLKPLRLTMSI